MLLDCRKTILFLALFAIFTKSTKANVKCWVCDGKRTLQACHAQYGQMLECSNADDVCQNDYRVAEGKPLITKGCKQKKACDTEVLQNKDKNQCGNKLTKNLVCRCCCATNGCNSKVSGCKPPPAPCKPIKGFKNGRPYCDREIKFGAQCQFRCNAGYKRVGPPKAICKPLSKGSKKGEWTTLPFCEKIIIRCDPPRSAPENGFVECRNSKEYAAEEELNYEGSVCTFSCMANHYLNGKKNTVCGNTKKWSNEDPKCIIGNCKNNALDANRIETCTSNYNFGSECQFECKKGYTLIGAKRSTCSQLGESSQGFWSKTFPRCVEVVCYPELTNPAHGSVTCTNANNKNSVCTYTCLKGYDLDDTRVKSLSTTCEDDGNGDALGVWSDRPPTCSRITCQPAFIDPVGGQVVCTDRNNHDSLCKFTCNSDHDLVGTKEPSVTSKCEDDGDGDEIGQWSREAVDCMPITCEPPYEDPENGKVTCTNDNMKNSVCTFQCEDDFDLDGTNERVLTSTCIADEDGTAKGTWTRKEAPTCSVVGCPPQPYPKHGFRICSTRNFMRGSFCVFYCSEGYDTVGSSYMTCQDQKQDGDSVGEWSTKTPECRLGQCTATKYDKSTVIEDCTPPEGYGAKEYRVGTVCRYRCINEGYYMLPNKGLSVILKKEIKSECDTKKQWTMSPPRCIMKTCVPSAPSLENGYTPQCTDGNNYKSKCTFKCQEKHALTHNRPLVCQDDGDYDEYAEWSDEFPKCERSECDDFGTVVNGRLNCTNGNQIGSICGLECIDRYTQKKYRETECLKTTVWSRRKYLCCVRCLFNKRLNIVAAYDYSSFESLLDWQYIVDFTETYLSEMVRYGFEIQFGAIGYSDEVDTLTQVPLQRLRYREDVSDVRTLIEDIPYAGNVAYTGKALNYINDDIYGTMERNREHFVILATSGRSKDEVAEIAAKMRARNINILTIGLKSAKGGPEEFLKISGLPRNVFTATRLQDLRVIPAKINEISRNTGCTPASRTQACP